MGGGTASRTTSITCTATGDGLRQHLAPWVKETSCDVGWISWCRIFLNVNDITGLPDDSDERQSCTGGQCPTEEIWKQERSRMAKLLKPRTTF
jgi:hypothetical protein